MPPRVSQIPVHLAYGLFLHAHDFVLPSFLYTVYLAHTDHYIMKVASETLVERDAEKGSKEISGPICIRYCFNGEEMRSEVCWYGSKRETARMEKERPSRHILDTLLQSPHKSETALYLPYKGCLELSLFFEEVRECATVLFH